MRQRDLILEKSINDYASTMATETLKIFKEKGAKKGVAGQITALYLTYFIEALVLEALGRYADEEMLTEKERYTYTRENFINAKTVIQNAVASGFEQAFTLHGEGNFEYYCVVAPTPEPLNKEPC
jgi:hypothetical protein